MPLSEEERDVRPVPPFDVTFESGPWRLAQFEPGQRLRLETARRLERSEVVRRLKVLVVSLGLAAALWAGWWATHGDFGVVVVPVIGLFLLVAAVSLPSLYRQVRRTVGGVLLEASASDATVRGVPEAAGRLADYAGTAVAAPLASVRAVVLSVHRNSGDQRPPKACATLRVHLDDGRALEGPDAWSQDAEWLDARDHLLPVAVELARLCARPLEVRYPFAEDALTLAPDALPARTDAPPPT